MAFGRVRKCLSVPAANSLTTNVKPYIFVRAARLESVGGAYRGALLNVQVPFVILHVNNTVIVQEEYCTSILYSSTVNTEQCELVSRYEYDRTFVQVVAIMYECEYHTSMPMIKKSETGQIQVCLSDVPVPLDPLSFSVTVQIGYNTYSPCPNMACPI